MLPELKWLVDLQELDKIIRGVTQDLERLPEELQAANAVLEEMQAEREAQAQELESLQKQRLETEKEVAEMEEGIKTSRQRLMEIKSNIEYKAMLKEIAFKEDQRDHKETRLLELLELMEAQKRSIAEQDQGLQEQGELVESRRKEVEVEVGKLKAELAGLEKQRKVLRKGVSAPLLKRYEFIRERRNGTAISPVHEGVCFGCHMNILPQQFIDLQKGEEILQCPHCQRILYWQDEEEALEGDLSRGAS
ncbi:MAG: C4-type zinc ribbon domain-containing protein [Thermodesulfobacteriota bacterium]